MSKVYLLFSDYNFVIIIKSMKVRLQSASRSDLPIYNPILPVSAITQVMLIANPNQVN